MYILWFQALCLYGISSCANVCGSASPWVSVLLRFFSWFVCFVLFRLVYFYFMLFYLTLFLDAYLYSKEK